jgi:hypothetical protein
MRAGFGDIAMLCVGKTIKPSPLELEESNAWSPFSAHDYSRYLVTSCLPEVCVQRVQRALKCKAKASANQE